MRPPLQWCLIVLMAALSGCREPAPLASEVGAPAAPGTTSGSEPAPRVDLPDILVVTLDTTSTAALAAMPNASAFLQGARRWSAAIAPSNSTVESVAGIFAGRWMTDPLLWEPDLVTLPEALQARGYHGFVASGNPVLDLPFFARGAEQTWLREEDLRPDFPDAGVVERFEAVWAELPRPRFAWIQLAACHDYRLAGMAEREHGWARTPAELAEAWAAYSRDCAATDTLLPRLLGANAGVTVLTADHGELFGDRGSYAFPGQLVHGHGVSDSPLELVVPLGIAAPGLEPGDEALPVSLLDLRSTLLRLAGAPTGPDLLSGTGLRPPIAQACNIHGDQTASFAVLVEETGAHVLHARGAPRLPTLARWLPQGVGLRPLEPLTHAALDPAIASALAQAVELPCVAGEDLCRQHPELVRLGYLDCR